MTQSNDPRGPNGGNRAQSQSGTAGGSRPHQDTVLLSDVPDVDTMHLEPSSADETRISSRGTNSPAPSAQSFATASPSLSTAALAALSQRYDVLSEAGHGSMGNVYKARDRETGETVALKLLKPEIASDQQMIDRFKNELLFARKITHKNVCRVHDFNRLGGIAYTSMEFVEGESLRAVLNRFGALSLRKGVDLAQQICSGLKEAHAQGIVHRDLKPENIMIDARGNVKIMDFGIARSMESLTRMTGAMVGTPAYMAPEQVAGKPVDYRTDIYSLGLILYEIFTGAQAFAAENAVAVAMKQLRESPVPPHEIEPSLPVPIERAILKALEKEPEKRFQSVAEMEKIFVSPSATGVPFAAGSTTAGRSTQDALAMQPAVAHPVQPVRSILAPAPQKSSGGKWAALIVFILFVLFFAAASGRWSKIAKQSGAFLAPAPPEPAAPGLPDFAYRQASTAGNAPTAATGYGFVDPPALLPNTAVPQSQSPTNQAAAPPSTTQPPATANAAPPAPVTANADTAANVVPLSAPRKAAPDAGVSVPGAAPADVQQRADAAFKENQAATPATGATSSSAPSSGATSSGAMGNQSAPVTDQPMGSVLRGNGPSYIWVARFDREERAQDATRKLQGFGLHAVVMPRHDNTTNHAFFVVFTGPLPPGQIPSYIDWLKTQGFPDAREVKAPNLGQQNGRGFSGNSQPNPNGASQ